MHHLLSDLYLRIQIDAFTGDYASALARSIALDTQLKNAAGSISSSYSDLVSLSTRQVFGSLDITVSQDSQGKPDPSDVMVFMKDIGASGFVIWRNYAEVS